MKTRHATVHDVPAIQRLYRELDRYHAELLPAFFRALTEDARPDSLVRDRIENPDADYLLAEDDGQIIGCLDIRKADHPRYPMFRRHEFALIDNVVVEKSHRGGGIGTQLFNAAVAWTRERGLDHIQTTVWSANTQTREFYRRQGFAPLTERLELDLRESKTLPTDADNADKPRS